MSETPPPHSFSLGRDAHDLGESLAPVLREACGGCLGPIEFFRSPFQHGGAATGFASWRGADGASFQVMVKLPVGWQEHRWTCALGSVGEEGWHSDSAMHKPVARVVASGTSLGGYDLAWLVVERLGEPAHATHPEERHVHELLEAAAEFQKCALGVAPLGEKPRAEDWGKLLERARSVARLGAIPESQKWNEAVHRVQKVLPQLVSRWELRPVNAWCHGDLHLGNMLHRKSANGSHGKGVLVDLALVHCGHWVEDAVYLERQYWGHAGLLHGVKPVSELARLRRERGLPANDSYPDLANVRRVLMAASAPAFAEHEGNAKYLHAALEVIERVLPQVAK